MRNLWFITNPGSGSTTKAKCEALEAVFSERGLSLVGRTDFPEQKIPTGEALDAQHVDTVVLFAGDGTINAALCALADWGGAYLILPGGTMNLLARALHSATDPHAIIEAAHDCTRRVAMPYVEAGPHRAFVGLILGPATAWARAREAVRKGRLIKLLRAARVAWSRTFWSRGIRIDGVPELPGRYHAVFVQPEGDAVEVTAIDSRDWRSIVGVGWDWLTGSWVENRNTYRTAQLQVRSKRPLVALFDGEPVMLEPGTPIRSGTSLKAFIATREEIG